ncbi:Leaf rust 10 disease resistance locus receptor-like protein kinase-like 1.2 [Vitis vinifera]|uniref:non-specific serine/threonine protein kinase n=1 Tax=Vitis vinifera TaxID=29760 RepID=A0A438JZ39_VITVI|nr:Leaf rust 10 disease resistance locus receptor-like protein kinase-like 1.2 [Vitis vinifera]
MDAQNIFIWKSTFCIIVVIIIFTSFVIETLSADPKFEACKPHNCGTGPNVSYPFWIPKEQESYCGFPNFSITCNDEKPVLTISDDYYVIREIFYTNHSFLMSNSAVYDGDSCPTPLHNFSLDRTPFNYSPSHYDLLVFYNCTSVPVETLTIPIDCMSNATLHSFASFHEEALEYMNFSTESCQSMVNVPVDIDALVREVVGVVDLKTMNSSVFARIAHISELAMMLSMFKLTLLLYFVIAITEGLDIGRKVIIARFLPGPILTLLLCLPVYFPSPGVSAGVCTLLIASIFFLMYLRRYKKHYPPPLLSRNISSDPSSKTIFESQGSLHGVHIFTYEELEEATNNFDSSKELGDGGFGTVYHGKLRDGRVVAVKRLYENNYKRVEQFMNEVEILQLLRHRNLVSLYGCTSRHSRELLLVYEYVPNGTVADHLHGEQAKPGSLTWPTRMKIAIETASALKYLHASDIIHRDVKTNNILLDSNFSVKVADFGLSRLFPTDVTHVSTAPQGTPGYVDPDYHQCYQLTSKSDVYSFGVVLIELISSMPAVDITRHRHEINLSNMAINKIQNHALHELVDRSLGFDSDQNIRRMIMAVAELAFQCLQNEKEMRPAMDEVLEVLMGIESEGCNIVKTEEVEIPADSVGLLKSKQPPASPDSVTTNWTSWPSTTNGSS